MRQEIHPDFYHLTNSPAGIYIYIYDHAAIINSLALIFVKFFFLMIDGVETHNPEKLRSYFPLSLADDDSFLFSI